MTTKNILNYKLFKKSDSNKKFNESLDYEKLVTEKLSSFFYGKKTSREDFFLTSSARSSLNIIFKSLAFESESEVIILGHTCAEVPNVLLINNLIPIYCDIDLDTFTFDREDLFRKIRHETKAIIIQHHLGICDLDFAMINSFKEKGIIVIEDCALSLGSSYKGIKAGSLGNFSVFSFGKSKTFNSYIGGCIKVNSSNSIEKIRMHYNSLIELPSTKIRILKAVFLIENKIYNSPFFYAYFPFLIILKIIFKILKVNYHVPETNLNLAIQKFDFKLPKFFIFLLFNYLEDINLLIVQQNERILDILSDVSNNNSEKCLPKAYFDKDYFICSNRIIINKKDKYLELFSKFNIVNSRYNFYSKPVDGNLSSSNYKKGMCPNSEYLCDNMAQISV